MAAVSAAVLCEPLNGSTPLQPPDAVQDVAFEELHVIFETAPLSTLLGEALMDATGGGVEPDEPSPPQDIRSSSHATVAKLRLDNCMHLHHSIANVASP